MTQRNLHGWRHPRGSVTALSKKKRGWERGCYFRSLEKMMHFHWNFAINLSKNTRSFSSPSLKRKSVFHISCACNLPTTSWTLNTVMLRKLIKMCTALNFTLTKAHEFECAPNIEYNIQTQLVIILLRIYWHFSLRYTWCIAQSNYSDIYR